MSSSGAVEYKRREAWQDDRQRSNHSGSALADRGGFQSESTDPTRTHMHARAHTHTPHTRAHTRTHTHHTRAHTSHTRARTHTQPGLSTRPKLTAPTMRPSRLSGKSSTRPGKGETEPSPRRDHRVHYLPITPRENSCPLVVTRCLWLVPISPSHHPSLSRLPILSLFPSLLPVPTQTRRCAHGTAAPSSPSPAPTSSCQSRCSCVRVCPRRLDGLR